MISAVEINEFFRKRSAICKSFETCSECPISVSYGHCRTENLTQKQVETIMNWEPPVDWSTVPVDTKVIVWAIPEQKHRRYFAKYEGGVIYTFEGGTTSWSREPDLLVAWKYGRLAEDDE